MIIEFTDVIVPTERSKEMVCRAMRDILKQSKTAILFDRSDNNALSLVDRACDQNKQVADFIGNIRYIEGNWKLRTILNILRQETGRTMQVQDKPIALRWIGDNKVTTMMILLAETTIHLMHLMYLRYLPAPKHR